jgi:hypothetical protein
VNPLRALQQCLPKNLLFGLYGAVGALLGALIVGELFWRLLVPPPPPPPPPPPAELHLAVSPEFGINQGDSNQLDVRIARDNLGGPVTISCAGLPSGVTVTDAVIAADAEGVELTALAAKDAAPGRHQFKIEASCGGLVRHADVAVDIVEVKAPPPPQVDIVFVLDVTGSMRFALEGLLRGIGNFTKELAERQLDARVGLVAFEDLLIGEALRALSFGGDGRLTSHIEAFREELKTVRIGGGGDEAESSLDALAEAARFPFRQGSTRVLLLITDAPPHVPDRTMQSLEACREVLLRSGISQLHLVVQQDDKRQYESLHSPQRMEGEFFDLMEAARGDAGFARILPSIGSTIARITIQSRPAAPEMVKSNAAPAPALPTIKGVQSSQEFSEDSRGQLLAAIALWTIMPAVGITLLLMAGQHFYMKESLLPPTEILKGLLIGGAAGLVGGLSGQLLYGILPASSWLDALLRVFGWAVLGACIAAGVSLSIPNLPKIRALLGGAAGGAIGACGFLVTVLLLPKSLIDDTGGRLVGATLIGFFIGLMVAWVESAFRSAWLEIRYGGGERRLVTLGPEPVSLGADTSQSTIYIAGADPVACKYRIRDRAVVCDIPATGQSSTCSDGHVRRIGSAEIIVRTSSGVSAATHTPQDKAPPPPPPPPRGGSTAASGAGQPKGQTGQLQPSPTTSPRPVPRDTGGSRPPPPPPPPPRKS